MGAAGIPVEPLEPPCPATQAQRIKESLQAQKKALDNLHRMEKAQAARKARIEALQSQIDAVTKEFVRGKEELEAARHHSIQAQQEHQIILEEREFSDCIPEEIEHEDNEDIKDDPAVIAGKRSYLHALAEARKRQREEAARLDTEMGETGAEDVSAPLFGSQPPAAAAADRTVHDLAEDPAALAGAAGDQSAAQAALETISAITSTLARAAGSSSPPAAGAAPKPKATARAPPYTGNAGG